jgi:hypothetical protein
MAGVYPPDTVTLIGSETVDIREGADLDIRAITADGQEHLEADTDAAASVALAEGTESVFIWLCTADGRCVNYEAEVRS